MPDHTKKPARPVTPAKQTDQGATDNEDPALQVDELDLLSDEALEQASGGLRVGIREGSNQERVMKELGGRWGARLPQITPMKKR
jgi:hypothetical protein